MPRISIRRGAVTEFNTCVEDAGQHRLKLAAVLQGWAPESLLDSYQVERRPVAERTIAAAANQEAFLAPSFATAELDADDDAGVRLRADLADRLQVKHSEFHSLGLVLGYDYRDSAVVVADGVPLPEPALDTFVPSGTSGRTVAACLAARWPFDLRPPR